MKLQRNGKSGRNLPEDRGIPEGVRIIPVKKSAPTASIHHVDFTATVYEDWKRNGTEIPLLATRLWFTSYTALGNENMPLGLMEEM